MPSPEHESMVASLPLAHIPEEEFPPEQMIVLRRAHDDIAEATNPLPEDIWPRYVDANGVPGTWFEAPGMDPQRIILYMHGGGYKWGSPRSHGELISRISRVAKARCLGIDYRLSPENAFPAAIEDTITAYRWLIRQGVSKSRIVLVGDAAGAGLVLAAIAALKGQGDPLPAAGVCVSAWTDLALTGNSVESVDDPFVTRKGLELLARSYLQGADPKSPMASPLYADYSSLPPLLIQVGTRELLLDDSVRVAEKAKSAGVDVILEKYEGVVHLWHWFGPNIPESIRSVARIGEFILSKTA